MAYRIEFKPSAAKEFSQLPKNIQKRIAAKVNTLADNPRPRGVEKLEGRENRYPSEWGTTGSFTRSTTKSCSFS